MIGPQRRQTDKNFTVFVILGTVDAFTSLECEVVYQPTFSAPEETDFLVHVTGGSDLKLKCTAKVQAIYQSSSQGNAVYIFEKIKML